MKLFNNKLYVILLIKEEEKLEVINLAKEHNLKILYEDMFINQKGDLHRICIDDNSLGGVLGSIQCFYELNNLKKQGTRVFKNVKELKEYVDKATNKKEHRFVLDKNINDYYEYVKSLDFDSLKDECLLANNIINYIDLYYSFIRYQIEKNLSNSIKGSISNNVGNLETVDKELNTIVKLRDEIDDAINTNTYLIDKDIAAKVIFKSSDKNMTSIKKMRSYLKRMYSYFHFDESSYIRLKTINKNLDIIFNIFNYKLKLEGIISYKHDVYKSIHELGYKEDIPDYLVGKKNKDGWDYISVLKRLLYSLKIYDSCLLSNELIPVVSKNADEIECLAKRLISLGYIDKDDLTNSSKHSYIPKFILIEPNKKIFRDGGGITILSCICSSRKIKPLYVNDVLEHFDKVIVNYDFAYLRLLLLKINLDKSREMPQLLSLEEARKIKGNKRIKDLINMVEKAKKK